MNENCGTYCPDFSDPEFPHFGSYLKGRSSHMTFDDIQKLRQKLAELNLKIERQLGALKEDIAYYFSGHISFTDLICSYAQIEQLSYKDFRYGFFDDGENDSTLTIEQEIRLQYAKDRIWKIILEQGDSRNREQQIQDVIDIFGFFAQEFGKLRDQYPESYDAELSGFYLDAHHPMELIEKMGDPNRFFRIVWDNETGKVVAYFESRKSPTYHDTQVVQWIFVNENYRHAGIVRKMWQEFEGWCRENSYKSMWSYVALRNTISQDVHEKLMPNGMRGVHDKNTFIYVQGVSPNNSIKDVNESTISGT